MLYYTSQNSKKKKLIGICDKGIDDFWSTLDNFVILKKLVKIPAFQFSTKFWLVLELCCWNHFNKIKFTPIKLKQPFFLTKLRKKGVNRNKKYITLWISKKRELLWNPSKLDSDVLFCVIL